MSAGLIAKSTSTQPQGVPSRSLPWGQSRDPIEIESREPQIESAAFQQAQLKSEYFRILLVLTGVVAVVLLRGMRGLILQMQFDVRIHGSGFAFIAGFVFYEVAMLVAVRQAIKGNRPVRSLAWIGDIIIETALPALGIAFLTSDAIAFAYRPLANPLALAFFLFIILSMLRLNPWACALSGLTAAVSYLAAAYFLGWRPPLYTHASIQSPEATVVSYALGYLGTGAVAAVVARELRKYIYAALREAETRRQMERLQHEMKVARSIQQSLLPNAKPKIAGFDIAGWNLPADETGGDFYDWEVLPNGQLVVVLADVTGHGLGPAMLAASCRAYTRANFSGPDGLLAGMDRINTSLATDLTAGQFVTLVAASCNPHGTLELLSAGHGPLFLYIRRDDRIESVNAQGLPLGILHDLTSDPPRSIELSSGDLLVLATDGLWEWENTHGEQFGRDRLEQVIRQLGDLSAQEIIAGLYKGVLEFCGGTKQQDDLTIVIIKRTETATATTLGPS